MNRGQLQYNRTRVPAIPPRLNPKVHEWVFDSDDFRRGVRPVKWNAFLLMLDIRADSDLGPVRIMKERAEALRELALKAGWELSIKHERNEFNSIDRFEMRATGKPRVSQKLLQTFQWKMRKHIKKE